MTSQNQVSSADIGKRVTFQFILPNGHNVEAVGVLEYFDDEAATYMVRNKKGEVVRVPERDVRFGKVIS